MRYLILVLIIFTVSCKENKHPKRYTSINGRVIQESFYENGALKVCKYYSKDTAYSNGAEIHYSVNGKIKKWYWFDRERAIKYGQDKAVALINYDSLSQSYSIVGDPFIRFLDFSKKGIVAAELISPPDSAFNFVLEIKDSFEGSEIKKWYNFPGITDSSAWSRIKINKGHKYNLKYILLNNADILLDSSIASFKVEELGKVFLY